MAEQFLVKILPGLWTAECIQGPSEHIGKNFTVRNPWLKDSQQFGLYAQREYIATLVASDTVELLKNIKPFPQ